MTEDLIEEPAARRRNRGGPAPTGLGVLGGDAQWSLARLLRAAGIEVADAEPAPKQISATLENRYNFGLSSLRCGRMGDFRQARQLISAAVAADVSGNWIWRDTDGGFVDGFRPGIDPEGLADEASQRAYRGAHLSAVRRLSGLIGTLILPITSDLGWVDAADGLAYPAPPPAGSGPSLQKTVYDLETMAADFALLHAALQAWRPGLRLWLVVGPPDAADDRFDGLARQARLRALCADLASRHDLTFHEPVLDHLLGRLADAQPDPRLGPAITAILNSGDPLALLAQAPAAPVAGPAEAEPNRREKRRRQKGGDAARVMCEDELLEAFS